MAVQQLGKAASRAGDTLRLSDVWGRLAVADASYAAKAADIGVAITAITAARTITLPPISTMVSMRPFAVWDESGSLTANVALSVAPAGSDLIIGASAPIVLATAYQIVVFYPTPRTWIF